MKLLASFFILAVLIAGIRPAHADESIGESVDWLLTVRPSVAIEEVTSTTPIKATFGTPMRLTIETALKTALKGNPPQNAKFDRRWQPMGVPGQDDTARPENGTEYLLFFDEHGGVTNAINLKYPSRKVGLGADPDDVALNDDFTIYKSGDLIMDTVHERLLWLKDHPPPPDATAPKSNIPAGAERLAVPMTSPAWDVLYSGISDQCALLIPADMKNGGGRSYDTKQAPHVLTFTGPVLPADCYQMPEAVFQIISAVAGAPHTLSPTCDDTNDDNYPNMTLEYRIYDALHDADYGFEWGSDPDDLADSAGFFTNRQELCERMARIMMFRLPRGKVLPPDADDPRPMYAAWEVQCIPNDRWGFVLEFLLSIRSTPDSAAAAATQPVATVSTAVLKDNQTTDVVVLAKKKVRKPPPKPGAPTVQGQTGTPPATSPAPAR